MYPLTSAPPQELATSSIWDVQSRRKACIIRPADPHIGLGSLLLGSATVEENLPELKEKKISHILQIGDGLLRSHSEGFVYKTVMIKDNESADIRQCFDTCKEFIDGGRSTGHVLVHCQAGVSRSATVMIAYLMLTERLSMDAATASVRAARPVIKPNAGFRQQLADLEASLHAPALHHVDNADDGAHPPAAVAAVLSG